MTKRFEVVDEGDGQYHVDIGDAVKICWQCQRHGNGMTNWRVQPRPASLSPTITIDSISQRSHPAMNERVRFLVLIGIEAIAFVAVALVLACVILW
jgi:hypothetical protein